MKGSNDGTGTGTGQVLRVEGTNVVRVPFGVRSSRRPRPNLVVGVARARHDDVVWRQHVHAQLTRRAFDGRRTLWRRCAR